MNRLVDIKSMDLEELSLYLVSIEEQKFRGKQLYSWIHEKGAVTFDEMTNLSKTLIEKLKENCKLTVLDTLDCKVSKEDNTKKFLFELADDQVIESVFMQYKHGNSVCISSQAGCKMGCKFCASTTSGLVRNLTPAEMLDQIYGIERETGEKIGNIVIMGTGEPFDNYENLLKFIKIINSPEGRNIGQRSITVSTCGIVPRIYDFANECSQVNLAISLHAPNDAIREQIMPIARKYTFEELMESVKYYLNKTNRRITFEYGLINGLNDSKDDAYALSRALHGMLCHVNLIPINSIDGKKFEKSSPESTKLFIKILESKKITTTLRRTLGDDVDAACGQLRRKHSEKKS
ncbi:MAG: 23S rRNA (adenine(2503)-C(2))-methyltransferase RlmN [Vallitaleaceae bacterium]|nr:23S rRNA (adenine(2503)-C(2))-methyltransferase RlmN [Vallitaleaceae bacterium]